MFWMKVSVVLFFSSMKNIRFNPIRITSPSGPPELYSDATKQFSSKFVQVVEAFVSERISSLTLAPGDAAFSFLDSNFHLSKFKLSSEQVLIFA